MTADRPTVVFVHGLWLHSTSWAAWQHLFTEAGYRTLAPEWPGVSDSIETARANPDGQAGKGIADVVAQYAAVIHGLDRPPIVIGHSFGGLIAQRLLGENLAAAAVAIDPAQIKGVRVLPPAQLRAGFPVLGNPANRKRTVALTPAQFRYGFGNALSQAESDELHARWTIPSPGRPLFEAAFANFSRHSPAEVNTRNANRGPLLLISGGQDHTVPGRRHAVDLQAVPQLGRDDGAAPIPRPGALADHRPRLAGYRRRVPRVARLRRDRPVMELSLDGRVAVVTGASKGIGLAVATALADEGARVVAGARSVDSLRGAHERIHPVAVDLAVADGPARLVEEAVATFGGVDILVNNVGLVRPHPAGFLAITDEMWLSAWNLNLMMAVRSTRAAVPRLLERRGTIVTVSSVNAFLPDPPIMDYTAAKAALTNFSKALSKELGPQGVRVNTVSPGPVGTQLWLGAGGVAETFAAATGSAPEEIAAGAVAGAATGRFTTPEEVADLVVLLASGRAGNVTGADFVIDGGLIQTL